MNRKLYLIDGSGFIFRAFHALPPLKNPQGIPVGAVYGFCNMLLRFLEKTQTNQGQDYLAVIFDAARKTFRQDIYPDYKAHRPQIPEDLIPQFSLIRRACEAFQIPAIELEGYEADDLIASYTHKANQQGVDVVIVSCDKDLMQLVSTRTTMLDPIKDKPITCAEVMEKFGVPPNKVIEVQALAGDSVDNIPGIPGIGVKTAAELIRAFGDLDSLLQNASLIKQQKRRQLVLAYADNARISKQLVTLQHTVPLPLPLESLEIKPLDFPLLKEFVQSQGFISLANRLEKQGLLADQNQRISKDYYCITDLKELAGFIQQASSHSLVAFVLETTSLNTSDISGFSLSFRAGTGVYIPIAHKKQNDQLPLEKEELLETQLSLEKVIESLRPLLLDPSILKIGHNLKHDLRVLKKYQMKITPITDIMVMSYVLDGHMHGQRIDELAKRHLMYTPPKYTDLTGTGKNQKSFDKVDVKAATFYAAETADITLRLYHHLSPRISTEKVARLYERIERPLISILAEMEVAGVKVDEGLLRQLGNHYAMEMMALETNIHQLAGQVFNIGSPQQLGDILFRKMGFPAPKKSKTGAYSTDADVLEKLSEQGDIMPKKVLEWRGLSKLKSTYVDGLLAALTPQTGRIHTSYSMVGTSTGRLASSNPNLQNIPIRTDKGRQIRRAFIAERGHKLVSIDYSQIELRLLAHLADVPALSQAFRRGIDIHTATACEIFGLSLNQMTGDLRRRAKAINFGIVYGISAFGLARQLSISQGEAADYIKSYFEKYPGIHDYMERSKAYAREHGYVKTLFGRKCFIPGILDKNATIRSFAERQAINAPLQGTNADIIKQAMTRIPENLSLHQLQAKMVLQVHDELIFEVPETEIHQTTDLLKKVMEGIVCLKVPLVVGIGIGHNWEEAHS